MQNSQASWLGYSAREHRLSDADSDKTQIVLQPMISDHFLEEPTLVLSLGPMGEQAPNLISGSNRPQFSPKENVDDQVVIFTPSYEISDLDSERKKLAPSPLKFQVATSLPEPLHWQEKKPLADLSTVNITKALPPITPAISQQTLRPALPISPPPTPLPDYDQHQKNPKNATSIQPGCETAKPKPTLPSRESPTSPTNPLPKKELSSKNNLSSQSSMPTVRVAYAERRKKRSTKSTGASVRNGNYRRMKSGSVMSRDKKARMVIYAAAYPPNDMTFKNMDFRRSRRRKNSYFTAFERTTLLTFLLMLSLFVNVKQLGPQGDKTIPAGQVQLTDSVRDGVFTKILHIVAELDEKTSAP